MLGQGRDSPPHSPPFSSRGCSPRMVARCFRKIAPVRHLVTISAQLSSAGTFCKSMVPQRRPHRSKVITQCFISPVTHVTVLRGGQMSCLGPHLDPRQRCVTPGESTFYTGRQGNRSQDRLPVIFTDWAHARPSRQMPVSFSPHRPKSCCGDGCVLMSRVSAGAF